MALNPVAYTEKVLNSFLRYQLTAYPFAVPGCANFRTPASIAYFIKATLAVEFDQRNTLPGLGVELFSCKQPAELEKILAHRVTELVRAGFGHEDIAIVSCRGMNSTALGQLDSIGSYPLRRFTGEYDTNDNQIYTEGKLRFDTIFRFKGQQAPVVILVDLDETFKCADRGTRILYCAMTRATVRLELVVHEDCPWINVFRESL